MADATGQKQNPALAWFVLLMIRGTLLWIVIPLAVCAWAPAAPWLSRRGVRLGHFLGWVDLNLIAFLTRIILRPLFRAPTPWVPASAMEQVTHRVSELDLA
jgi:hypothetical protein